MNTAEHARAVEAAWSRVAVLTNAHADAVDLARQLSPNLLPKSRDHARHLAALELAHDLGQALDEAIAAADVAEARFVEHLRQFPCVEWTIGTFPGEDDRRIPVRRRPRPRDANGAPPPLEVEIR